MTKYNQKKPPEIPWETITADDHNYKIFQVTGLKDLETIRDYLDFLDKQIKCKLDKRRKQLELWLFYVEGPFMIINDKCLLWCNDKDDFNKNPVVPGLNFLCFPKKHFFEMLNAKSDKG